MFPHTDRLSVSSLSRERGAKKGKLMNIEKDSQTISAEDFAALGSNSLVYVREVDVDQIQQEMLEIAPEQSLGEQLQLADEQRFFAIHLADGTRVAVLTSRDAAFTAARQHNMSPVSVH